MRWGPQSVAPGRVRFSLWAPDSVGVLLELDGRPPVPMGAKPEGWFVAEASAEPGARYRFQLDGGLRVPDPASRVQQGGPDGWSVLVDHAAYRWGDDAWRGRPFREALILEVHAGLLGGFEGVARRLPALADLGFTAIELMPIGAFSGTRNWGYDGVLPYAPTEAYGSPDALKALVGQAHDLGVMVYLDVVYNHFGPQGNYLGAYASPFFDHDRHNMWGDALAFDREPVARFFIDNALMWVRDYHLDGLRLDAVHAIDDPDFLDRLALEVRHAAGERQVHLMLENEHNDAERLPWPFDAQWNDDFHNVVHVLLTGETDGYYGDFADAPAQKLARCLSEGFIFQGDAEASAGKTARGKPSGHLPPSAFINFLQNHDQTGNRAFGERLGVLAEPEALRAATALLLLTPFVPLMFMGDEAGSQTPFYFFTDFHDGLADAVREGRRREFAAFPALADPEARARIPDPNAIETFEQSCPQPGPHARASTEFLGKLIALRRREIMPHLDSARSLGAEACGESSVFAAWRLGETATLTVLVNFGKSAAEWGRAPSSAPKFSTGDARNGPGCSVWLEKN